MSRHYNRQEARAQQQRLQSISRNKEKPSISTEQERREAQDLLVSMSDEAQGSISSSDYEKLIDAMNDCI
jgi:hypothetical protein